MSSLDGFSGYVNTTIAVSPMTSDPPSVNTSYISLLVTPSAPGIFAVKFTVDATAVLGPYSVQMTAVTKLQGGVQTHWAYLTVTVGPDFSMSASPANLVVHQGTLAISFIMFTSLNGFAGGMMLEAAPLSVLPPNPRTNFFPSYPILSPGGTNSTEFWVIADQSTGLGTYNVWLSASTGVQVGFGWISHAIPMTITIEGPVTGPDFALSAQPSHVDLSIGSMTTSTISLNSVNGFSGALTLQVESDGVLGSLSPASATISPTIPASSTLSVTAPTPYQIDGYPLWYPASGGRTLLVIASNSIGFSHWAWVNETVSPVSVVPSPAQLDIPKGSSATSQIVISSLSGFNLTVGMSVISPSGLTTSLSNSFINFSTSNAPVMLFLTINVTSTTAQGDYVVLVTATSMSHQWFCQCSYYNITYTTPIYVRVAPSSPPSGPGPNTSPPPNGSTAGIFGLPPTEFYGIISAAAMALLISVGYLGFRGRKKPVA
jgi:molybdopterin-binding protein